MSVRRIVRTPGLMSGVPCFDGTRIPPQSVESVYRWHLSRLHDPDGALATTLRDYPRLDAADVREALRWCRVRRPAWAMRRRLAAGLRAAADAVEPWGGVA